MSKKKENNSSDNSQPMRGSIFTHTARRAVGFFIAFIGLTLIFERSAITSVLPTVTAIFMLLGGLYLVSTYLKKLGKREDKNHAWAWIFVGFLMMAFGVLLLIKGGFINKWIIVSLGVIIAVYGLVFLIASILSKGRSAGLNIAIAVLTLVCGVLIALLAIPQIASFKSGLLYILFGSFAATVGVISIVVY